MEVDGMAPWKSIFLQKQGVLDVAQVRYLSFKIDLVNRLPGQVAVAGGMVYGCLVWQVEAGGFVSWPPGLGHTKQAIWTEAVFFDSIYAFVHYS